MLRFVTAVLLASLCSPRPPPPRRARAPIPARTPPSASIGQRAEGVLRFPQASAVGPDGSVYVADQYTHAIQVFGPDGELPARARRRRLRPGRADLGRRGRRRRRRLGLRRRRRGPDRSLRAPTARC